MARRVSFSSKDYSSMINAYVLHFNEVHGIKEAPESIEAKLALECLFLHEWNRYPAFACVFQKNDELGFLILRGRPVAGSCSPYTVPVEVFLVDKGIKLTKVPTNIRGADIFKYQISGHRPGGLDTAITTIFAFTTREKGENFMRKAKEIFINGMTNSTPETHAWLMPFGKAAEKERHGLMTKLANAEDALDDANGPNEDLVLGFENLESLFFYSQQSALAMLLMASMELVNPLAVEEVDKPAEEDSSAFDEDEESVSDETMNKNKEEKKPPLEKIKSSESAKSHDLKKSNDKKTGIRDRKTSAKKEKREKARKRENSQVRDDDIFSGSEGSISEEVVLPIDIDYGEFILNKLEEREGEFSFWKTHSLYVVSWNTDYTFNNKDISIDKLLTPADKSLVDIYVIGLKNYEEKKELNLLRKITTDSAVVTWEKLIQSSEPFQKTEYVRLKRTIFFNLMVVIYARISVMEYVQGDQTLVCNLSLKEREKKEKKKDREQELILEDEDPKAVAIRLTIRNSILCFIFVTYPPTLNNVEQRNVYLKKTLHKVKFRCIDGDSVGLSDVDFVMLFGALNYGFKAGESDRVVGFLMKKDKERLLKLDELILCTGKVKEFKDFREAIIEFMPNGKYKARSDTYDMGLSGNDLPGYFDRILFRSKYCEPRSYKSLVDFKLSCYRPVVGYYSVGIRTIDDDLLMDAYEAVLAQTDTIFQLARSRVELSKTEINFQKLKFMGTKTETIRITNIGSLKVNVKIINESHGIVLPLPFWLTVEPESFQLDKDKFVDIKFSAKITVDAIGHIQNGQQPLCTPLKFILPEGNAVFIELKGKLEQTSIGLPLPVLSFYRVPIKTVDANELFAKATLLCEDDDNFVPTVFGEMPKEIVRLCNCLVKNCIKEPELFHQVGSPNEVCSLVDFLDTTDESQPLPNVRMNSVLDTLSMYLRSLADPLVPYDDPVMNHGILGTSFSDTVKYINSLKTENKQVFVYVMQVMQNILEQMAGFNLTPTVVAQNIALSIIHDFKRGPKNAKEKSISFIQLVLQNNLQAI